MVRVLTIIFFATIIALCLLVFAIMLKPKAHRYEELDGTKSILRR